MSHLSTHVLDTTAGCAAAGMAFTLRRLAPAEVVLQGVTNNDGRTDRPLLEGAECLPGVYELDFDVGAYFAGRGVPGPDPACLGPAFLGIVTLRFGVTAGGHYHVPLLVSPFAYSTYRGS